MSITPQTRGSSDCKPSLATRISTIPVTHTSLPSATHQRNPPHPHSPPTPNPPRPQPPTRPNTKGPYLAAQVLVELPYLTPQCIIYTLVLYFLLGLAPSAGSFFFALLVVWASSLCMVLLAQALVHATPVAYLASLGLSVIGGSLFNVMCGFMVRGRE